MGKKKNTQQEMLNLQAAQLAAQIAQQAAQQEFQRMRFQELEKPQFSHLSQMDKEQLAFQKAQQAWTESFQKASLTGTFGGQQTVAEQQRQYENQLAMAGLTGTINGQDTAEERWRKVEQLMSEAGLTGMYQGQQTTAERQRLFANALSEAGITGTYNGQETAAERAAKFERAVAEAGLTGTYGGQQTTDWQAQQAAITGRFQGADTLAREQMQNENSLALLNLQSSLRGPRNAFQYAQSLASTPGGLQQSLAAMAGRAQVPGFAGYNQPLQPASLGGLYGDIMGFQQQYIPTAAGALPAGPAQVQGPAAGAMQPQIDYAARGFPGSEGDMAAADLEQAALIRQKKGGYMGGPVQNWAMDTDMQGGYNPAMSPAQAMDMRATAASQQATSPFTVNPEGEQAPSNLYNYQPTGDGRYYSYPPGMMAPPEAMQVSTTAPMNYNEINKYLEQLPLGSQISSDYWNNQPQYMRDFMLSGYEARGEDAGLVEDTYKMSLPKYTGTRQGAFI